MGTELIQPQTQLGQTDSFEPAAKLMAATAMSQSMSFFLERKALDAIVTNNDISLKASTNHTGQNNVCWLKIEQVGKPINDKYEECFTAIQKILTSSFIPEKVQLLFMLHCESGVSHLYLGVRPLSQDVLDFSDSLDNFIKGIWPGLKCCSVGRKETSFVSDKILNGNKRYRSFSALTGIPSMESQYKSIYPATIDKLIAGMSGRDFTYLVIANPIADSEVDKFIFDCHEMQGQAESVKSFNFSESDGTGYNESFSVAKGITKTSSKKQIGTAAFSLAALVCPPIAYLYGANKAIEAMVGVNIASSLTSLIPETSIAKSNTETKTTGHSTNQSKTLSQNIVNKHIESIAEQLGHHAERFQVGKAIGCWDVGAYIMCENDNDMVCASMQTKSMLSGDESTYEPIRIHDISSAIAEKNIKESSLSIFTKPDISICVNAQRFNHPMGEHFEKLTTVLTTKELSYLVNFPLKSVPGISVIESSPDFNLNKQIVKEGTKCIETGKLLWSGSSTDIDIKLPIDTLCRHALVSGVNGSGKTNTILSVLKGMLTEKRPFLVIEPAKTEYVDWAVDYNKQHPDNPIKIFIPGCDKYVKGGITPDKLKINPFEVIKSGDSELRTISHIDRLKATFAAAFPMQDILPVVMEHLLYDLYERVGLLEELLPAKPEFPQLSDVNRKFIDDLMLNLGYAKENTQNISAALRTRFSSLKFGWKGDMLDNPSIQGMTWDDLFGTPVVVNLSYAGDDQDRAFMMSLLLQMLYEYRIAESESGNYSFNDNVCRHLVVVEEAHRVMMRCDNPELPQYKSGLMFSNFLSEVRAYGQGMMIVDQVPSRLIEDAIKNTNIKIIHKLVAEDDASTLAECIGLNDDQKRVIPKLSIGQALLAGFNSANVGSQDSSAIYLAQINKMK